MRISLSTWPTLVLAAMLAPLLLGASPSPDKTLSPPIIKQPIYDCAQIISFSGASRDSKIIVYVNGAYKTEEKTWMGWGEIRLPDPLKLGDKVSAVQVVNNRTSAPTRDPVTVTSIPPALTPGRKLMTPEIVPPLYECQRAVIVKDVLPGATVSLRNWDVNGWKGMTPYDIIRFITPELRRDQRWYNAAQYICEDPPIMSEWSAKVRVQARPLSLPGVKVRGPIVEGGDACVVEGVVPGTLVPGAVVDIYAYDGGGRVRVGGGIAVASAQIFGVNPPLSNQYVYRAFQSLCDTRSPEVEGVRPVKDVPAPTVQWPICTGEYYVTVCDTAALSTVKVYVNGVQVAEAAGNGGCVTIALGDLTKFTTGQVTAKQFVAGKPSLASAAVPIQTDGAPTYDPAYWNDPKHVRCNNCYNYACDLKTDTYAQPGYHALGKKPAPWTCTAVGNGAVADGLKQQPEKQCAGCTHVVALFSSPGGKPDELVDYHWYRLDDNGRWSHKLGDLPATDRDASGKLITNPETADRRYVGKSYILDYRVFCGYYCVDKRTVVIDGTHQCRP